MCLGADIRGATPHFDFVAGENASGIQDVMLTEDFPAAYGVITPNNLEQAIERARSNQVIRATRPQLQPLK